MDRSYLILTLLALALPTVAPAVAADGYWCDGGATRDLPCEPIPPPYVIQDAVDDARDEAVRQVGWAVECVKSRVGLADQCP